MGLKKPNNHGVPYSLTEEFVSVYRMHSLLPDYLNLRDISAAPGPNKSPPLIEKYNSLSLNIKISPCTLHAYCLHIRLLVLIAFLLFRVPLPNLIGIKGEKALVEFGFEKQMVSMGHQASGALELWNYPTWLRDLVPQDINGQDRPDHVDLPALEGSTS